MDTLQSIADITDQVKKVDVHGGDATEKMKVGSKLQPHFTMTAGDVNGLDEIWMVSSTSICSPTVPSSVMLQCCGCCGRRMPFYISHA